LKTNLPHIKRILSLIKGGKNSTEIASIIYSEFGIYKSIDEIQKIKVQSTPKDLKINALPSLNRIFNDEVIIKTTKEFLNIGNNNPKTAKEILIYINSKLSLCLRKEDINKLLHSPRIKNDIIYLRELRSYKLNTHCLIATENKIEVNDHKVGTSNLEFEGNIYKILFENLPFHNLFFHRFNSFEGSYEIVINQSHHLYNQDISDFITKFALAISHTKLTMTGNESEIFIKRFNCFLNLLE
jgi:hypothetical protein